MNVLDLCAGIGGFSLGLERAGMSIAGQCEIDPFCRQVLQKHWPDVPLYSDVKELTHETIKEHGKTIELICGGYPCQPFSTAGDRQGEDDDRHVWPEFRRLIRSLRPRWVCLENVAGHISLGLDSVLSDLDGLDYATEVFVLPACAVNAPHQRERVWVVAYPDSDRLQRLAHAGENNRARRSFRSWGPPSGAFAKAWTLEAAHAQFCGMDDGVPDRMDRIKALGNAVVPQLVQTLGAAILLMDRELGFNSNLT